MLNSQTHTILVIDYSFTFIFPIMHLFLFQKQTAVTVVFTKTNVKHINA